MPGIPGANPTPHGVSCIALDYLSLALELRRASVDLITPLVGVSKVHVTERMPERQTVCWSNEARQLAF